MTSTRFCLFSDRRLCLHTVISSDLRPPSPDFVDVIYGWPLVKKAKGWDFVGWVKLASASILLSKVRLFLTAAKFP